MSSKNSQSDSDRQNRIVAEARREREQREKTYRAKRSKSILGFAHAAGVNLVAKSFAN